jgi:hypothetical protein
MTSDEQLFTIAVLAHSNLLTIGGYRSVCVTRGFDGLCCTLPCLPPAQYTIFLGTGTRPAPWGIAMVFSAQEWQLTCASGLQAGPGYIIT